MLPVRLGQPVRRLPHHRRAGPHEHPRRGGADARRRPEVLRRLRRAYRHGLLRRSSWSMAATSITLLAMGQMTSSLGVAVGVFYVCHAGVRRHQHPVHHLEHLRHLQRQKEGGVSYGDDNLWLMIIVHPGDPAGHRRARSPIRLALPPWSPSCRPYPWTSPLSQAPSASSWA